MLWFQRKGTEGEQGVDLFDPGIIGNVLNQFQFTGSFDALTCWHPIHFGLVWSCPFCQGAFCEDSGGFWAEIKHARTTEERQAGAMGRLGGEGPKVGTVGMWRLAAKMI